MSEAGEPRRRFLDELCRWRRGSITRRCFLGRTGVGAAAAALGAAMPDLAWPTPAGAAAAGGQVKLATWVNYHDPKNFEAFTATTGIAVQTEICQSDSEIHQRLKGGLTGWDVVVTGDAWVQSAVAGGLLHPLKLASIPAYQPGEASDLRFIAPGMAGGKTYGLLKDWGTTGFCVNRSVVSDPLPGWREFWTLTRGKLSRRVTVPDDPILLVGNALKFYGYSFDSLVEKELAEAEILLLDAKAHLLAVADNPQPGLRSGDAWLAMAGTGDALLLHREVPGIEYIIAREGGQIWGDYYAVPKASPHHAAAFALIDFLLTPAYNRQEALAHGYAVTDKRVLALLPREILANPIVYPAPGLLAPLEFAAAACLTNPRRVEIMARFHAAGGGR